MFKAAKSADQTDKVVVFSLQNQLYGIDIASVLEIIRMELVTSVPGTPYFIEGIINLRGKVVPVMDLGKKFEIPSSRISENTRVIIVEAAGFTVGLIVDSVSEVLRFPASSVEPPPALISGQILEALRGIALVGEQLIILLDVNRLLQEKEKRELREYNRE